jgi:four helix bundle protein
MQDFRKLEIWHLGHELTLHVYKVVAAYPTEERFDLTSQTKRAASSIPANIAEGCGRKSNNELAHFCYIAMGSASELDNHFELALKLSYIDNDTHQKLTTELSTLQKKLNLFIQRVSTPK